MCEFCGSIQKCVSVSEWSQGGVSVLERCVSFGEAMRHALSFPERREGDSQPVGRGGYSHFGRGEEVVCWLRRVGEVVCGDA